MFTSLNTSPLLHIMQPSFLVDDYDEDNMLALLDSFSSDQRSPDEYTSSSGSSSMNSWTFDSSPSHFDDLDVSRVNERFKRQCSCESTLEEENEEKKKGAKRTRRLISTDTNADHKVNKSLGKAKKQTNFS